MPNTSELLTTKIRWGFRSKNQLPWFMVWREYHALGEVVYAKVLFSTVNWSSRPIPMLFFGAILGTIGASIGGLLYPLFHVCY